MDNGALEVSRVIAAPIDRVWEAWTDPAAMKQWYGPANMTTPQAEADLQVGGKYRVTMKGDDGEHVVAGTYTAIAKPHTLGFTWKWEGSPEAETQVTVKLEEVEHDKTKVTLRHEGFASDESRDNHTTGWESTMDALEQYTG